MSFKSFLKKNFDEGTQIGKVNCIATAVLGSGAHFCFPFIFKYVFGIYENFFLRFVATILCISTAFLYKKHNLKLSLYWHFALTYVLPFIFTVNLLKSNFNELWLYWEIFMIFVLITYVPNWLIFLIDLFIGVTFAILYYFLTSPTLDFVPHFNIILYSTVIVFSAFVGVAFAHNNRVTSLNNLREQHKKLTALAGSIVHEIRNPLNTINLIGLNLKDLTKNMNVKEKEEFDTLTTSLFSSIKQSNEIINIVLSDLQDKPVNNSDFTYLNSLILLNIVDGFGYNNESERKKIKLAENHPNFFFKAIPERFDFIIYNLMKNALYYLDQYPDSKVIIGTETKEIAEKNYNVIYVQDSGPGIPKNVIGKLFGDFYTSGKKGGTGLGLAFCKRNMKLFGGDIICESEVGGEEEIIENGIKKTIKKAGLTKFSLLFPVLSDEELEQANLQFKEELNNTNNAKLNIKSNTKTEDLLNSANIPNSINTILNNSNSRQQEQSTKTISPKTKKILVVDDERTNLIVTKAKLEKFLSNQNFKIQCDIALGGENAIEMFKTSYTDNNQHYDLVLMDIQMPGFCGITTTKQIRELIPQLITNKSESQTELPIIALTSLDYKTFIDSSNKAQAKFSAYINKSSSNNILCRAVAKWMFDYKDNFSYLGTEEQYNSNLPNILKDKEVLLVDDQEINRKITKRSLERYGLKVSEGNNGEELIKHYKESLIDNTNYTVSQTKISKFSIIITDINMPIISGDEATLKVREIEDSNFTKYQNRIPIIALSGDGENKDIAKYLQSQMTDYFIKGNDPNLLIKIIANYIKDDEARKEAVCEDDMNNADIKNDIIKNNSDNNLYNQLSNTNSNTNNNTNNTNNTISANKNINTTLNSSTLSNKLNLPNLVIFNHSKIDFFEPQEKAEIINLFIADSNKSLNKIKEDNQQPGNHLNTSFDVHALKGMTSNIGGEKLVAFIRNIEISLKKNQAPENQNWIIELENLHQELVAEMKNLCKI